MGGEKSFQTACLVRCLGSPPRGRGKGVGAARIGCGVGITPAWAGKRPTRTAALATTGDHPRVGGEKTVNIILWHSCQGSPPRRRGKVLRLLPAGTTARITPAWAGKSPSRRPVWFGALDHPRVGVEKFITASLYRSGTGSPPHGRGKVGGNHVHGGLVGITPAWAGKRLACAVAIMA